MNIKAIYSRYVGFDAGHISGKEHTVLCPFHDDTKPSLSINLASGLWKCHTTSCIAAAGGTLVKFLCMVEDYTPEQAQAYVDSVLTLDEDQNDEPKTITKTVTRIPYSEDNINNWKRTLAQDVPSLKFWSDLGVSLELLDKLGIGFNGTRYTFPIYDELNKLVNIRMYTPKSDTGAKVIGVAGFNSARLWPFSNLNSPVICLFEGEKDCLVANALGINGVTVTGGSGTFRTEWLPLFEGKTVHICYDIDEAGKKGAIKVANDLLRVCNEVKIINLPITEPANGDFTDYTKQGGTLAKFNTLIASTPPYKKELKADVDIGDAVHYVKIADAIYNNIYYKRLKISTRVVGTLGNPFLCPRIVTITCNKSNGKHCETCSNGNLKGEQTIVFDETRVDVLKLLDCSDTRQAIEIANMFNVPSKCRHKQVKQVEHQFIEYLAISPTIDDNDYLQDSNERCIYMLNVKLETNQEYIIDAIMIKEPGTQKLTFLGYGATPLESSIDEFRMTPQLLEELKIWRV